MARSYRASAAMCMHSIGGDGLETGPAMTHNGEGEGRRNVAEVIL